MSTTPLSSQSLSGYFSWLDPLRFFAAISVVAFHLGDLAHVPLPSTLPGAWFAAGFLGVDLFFAISGAVILLSVARLLDDSSAATPSWRTVFVRRRMARLVPLYFLTSLLFVFFVRPELLQRPNFPVEALIHALFLPNLFRDTHGLINGPTWSLGVEMQFYAVMLLAAPWLLRRRVWEILLTTFVIALAWRWGVFIHFADLPAEAQGNRLFVATLQLPGVLDGFGAGMAAMLWRLKTRDEQAKRVFPWLLAGTLLLWWLLLSLLLINASHYWSHWAMLLGFRAGVALASGLLVATLLAVPRSFSPGRVGRWMGDLSYGVYLWHLGVILLIVQNFPSMNALQSVLVTGMATLLLAQAGWRWVERPALRLGQIKSNESAPHDNSPLS